MVWWICEGDWYICDVMGIGGISEFDRLPWVFRILDSGTYMDWVVENIIVNKYQI